MTQWTVFTTCTGTLPGGFTSAAWGSRLFAEVGEKGKGIKGMRLYLVERSPQQA